MIAKRTKFRKLIDCCSFLSVPLDNGPPLTKLIIVDHNDNKTTEVSRQCY